MSTSAPSRTLAVAAALVLLPLAGCAQDGAGVPRPTAPPAAPPTTSPTTPPPEATPVPTAPLPSDPGGPTSLPLLPRPTAPPTAPTDVPRPTAYEGVVVAPSAAGCTEMEVGGQVFTLVLPEGTAVAVGDRLRVRGTPQPAEAAHGCAGTRVVVTDVRPG